MIDLGDELAGYGEQAPARPPAPGQPLPTMHPGGSGHYSLADLQAAGFRRDDPHRGLRAMLAWASPADLYADAPALCSICGAPADGHGHGGGGPGGAAGVWIGIEPSGPTPWGTIEDGDA